MSDDDLDAAVELVRGRLRAILEDRSTHDVPLGEVESRRIAAGTQIDAYRVVRELGSGGMGTVYLAERADGAFTRQVALKVLRGVPTEEGRRRLRQERQLLSELDHPAIARLLDGGEAEGEQPYLVMEYVDGLTVLEHLRARRTTIDERIAIWSRVAEALAHAHQRLIIHRDLKPSNVLVRADGAPKVIDFGIAKLISLSADPEQSSTRAFTPGYASPEQEQGRAITTRTDVYALGTLLAEMLTGRRRLGGEPTAPGIDPVVVDADLSAIIAKARADDPRERFNSVDALLEDLDRRRNGLPVRARRWTTAYTLRKALVRSRVPIMLMTLATVMGTAFVLRLRVETLSARRAEQAALAERERAQLEARRAQRVVDYLVATFGAAAPEKTLGQKLTAGELLDRGEASLAAVPSEDAPPVLATLAELRGAIGDPVAALRLSATATRALGDPQTRGEALRLIELEGRRVGYASSAGRAGEAARSATRLEALRRQWAPDDPRVERSAHWAMGQAALMSGAQAEAEAHLRRVVSATVTGADQATLLETLDATAALADLALRREDGGAALREATRYRQLTASLPVDHPRRSFGLHLEASALSLLDRNEEAVPLFQRAIAEGERVIGTDGTSIALYYSGLTLSLNILGRFQEAQASSDREVAIEKARGTGPLRLVPALANASLNHEAAGDYDRADELLRTAEGMDAGQLLPELRVALVINRARIDAQRGDHRRARAALERILAEGGEELTMGRARLQLAQVELWSGHPAAAEAQVALLEAGGAASKPELAGVWRGARRTRHQAMVAAGRAAAALEPLRALEREYAEVFGERAFDTDLIRVDRAWALSEAGRRDEARELLRSSLPRLRRLVLPGERNRARAETLARGLGLE